MAEERTLTQEVEELWSVVNELRTETSEIKYQLMRFKLETERSEDLIDALRNGE